MNQKLSLRYINIVSISYILVVVESSFFPAWYNWGVSRLRVFNEMGISVILLSMTVILIPAVHKKIFQIYSHTIKSFQHRSLRNQQLLTISIFVFISSCFWYFNQKTFFLGDGYLLLRNLPLINAPIEIFGFYKNSPLSGCIFYVCSLFFKAFGVNNVALITYQWVSIISGILTLFFLNKIGKYIFPDFAVRLLFIVGVFSTAASQMFFSYVENYSVSIVIVVFYLYCSMRYLAEKKHFTIVTVSFCMLIMAHYGMVLAGPSYLYLLYKEYTRKKLFSVFFNLLLIFTMFLSLYFLVYDRFPVLYFQVFKENSHLLMDSIPGTLEFSYSWISSLHIIDLINLLLFVFPFTVLLIPYAVWTFRFREVFRNDMNVFIILCSAGTMLFLLAMKSDLGLSRDWDLYTLFLFPTLLCTILFTIKSLSNHSMQPMLIIIIITLISTTAWIAINATHDVSLKYFTTLPNNTLWSKKALTHTMDELGSFYQKRKDYKSSLHYNLEYLQYDPANIRIIENVASTYFYIFADDNNALPWYEKAVKAESNDWQVYNNLAEIRMKQQDYQSAMKLLEKSINFNPPVLRPKMNKAYILGTVINQKKEALALYDEVISIEPNNLNALLNAGYLSYQLNEYKRTKNYLIRYVNLAPDNSELLNIQNLLKSLH